jgi:chromosome segregation protein
MYLRSLTLKGFKSFADKTSLTFEPGVTAIVGPNGSGKSNITDGVLWVLGEQSAKSLRGSAMEDVIFAGSGARQPVGVAEITLTLDNTDHFIPIDFTELTVTRRMFRSGESEYMINNAPCRLLDVHDLLSDSGLGRETYSIISQGRLEETLNSRPEDRRLLIEEAAGVLKHKKRMERALRKLAAMEAHVNRVRDVVSEVERQLKPLKRQATQAEQAGNLAGRLRDCQIELAVLELRNLQRDWEIGKSAEDELSAELAARREAHAAKQEELSSFQGLLEEKGIFAGDLGEMRRRVGAVQERASSGLLLLEEKGKHLVERLSEVRGKIHQAEMRLAHFATERDRLGEEKESADKGLRAQYARLADLRRESEGAKKARLAVEDRQQENQSAQTKLKKLAEDVRAELRRIDADLTMLGAQRQVLEEQLAQATPRAEAAERAAAGAAAEAAAATAALASADKALAKGRSAIDRHEEVATVARSMAAEVDSELAAVRAKVAALEEVSKAFATASPAMAWIMSQEQKLPGVIGVLGDLVSVAPDHERAVEAALGSDLFCVLTKTTATMTKAIGLLREKGAGEIGFLPLDEAAGRRVRQPSAGTPIIDFIQADGGADKALAALIGDVYLMADLDAALKASAEDVTGARFVTPEGEIVWPMGKVTVGPLGDTSRGVLTRKRELASLKTDEDALAGRSAKAKAALESAERDLLAHKERVLTLTQAREDADRSVHILSDKVARVAEEASEEAADLRAISERLSEVADAIRKAEPHRAELDEKAKGHESEAGALVVALEELRAEREMRYVEELELSRALSECQIEIASVSERESQLRRQLTVAASEHATAEETLTLSRATAEALEQLRGRVEPIHDLYSALLERAVYWQDKLSERAQLEQADSVNLRDSVHRLQDDVRERAAAVEAQLGLVHEAELKRTQLELQVNAAVSRLVEEYEVSLEGALATPAERGREEIEQEIESLRRRLSNLGPVNPIALSECRTLEERAEFLTGQLGDLVASRTALTRIVSAIERKIRERFLETFEEVNQHFMRVFEMLFPGGRAELFLTEPDDVTATGIDIGAQPSGKKLQKLTLLSGGERSLVALAFLFALYHARPSPFYILDEVEAALDDTNLARFIEMIGRMKASTQFVVITHQRRTMESADVIYGVSMAADGVSKLLSQRMPDSEVVDEGEAKGAPAGAPLTSPTGT